MPTSSKLGAAGLNPNETVRSVIPRSAREGHGIAELLAELFFAENVRDDLHLNKKQTEDFSLFPSPFHHLVPLRLELSARFPLREFIAVGCLVTDFEEKLNILHCAGEIPIWINFV
jgi:hypothetical protein